MKKKVINIGLIILILFVWSYVINLVFHPFAENKNVSAITSALQSNTKSEIRSPYTLKMNYSDPFLKKAYRSEKKLVESKLAPKKKKVRVKPKTQIWPNLIYYGSIKSKSANEKIALVKINGNSHRLKENDFVNDLQVTKIWLDSISVTNNLANRVFTKKSS